MLGIPHPYLTAALPGIGGAIKERPEDFIVEEIPLYRPSGEGEHLYFEIEKNDLSTPEALERLGRYLRVSAREFGYAGLKDRRAITRQTLSLSRTITGLTPEAIQGLEVPQVKILSVSLHTNKLRVGHLKGNRFRIRIRNVVEGAAERVEPTLKTILERGLPNYFGPQRFGNRGDAHRIGRAFVRRDDRAAIRRLLGHPSKSEQNPHIVRARELFMAGDFAGARDEFPGTYREERRLLDYMTRAGENYSGAMKRFGESSRKLYFTAYQSFLFNTVLDSRRRSAQDDLGRLLEGDVAFLHRNGALFRVGDAPAEQVRADTFELSPSGPIFGKKMLTPLGLEQEIEEEALHLEGVQRTDFHQFLPRLHMEGGRRPFRVPVEELAWKAEGSDICLEFALPKGSYATTLLRELMKNDVVPEGFYEDGDGERFSLWRPEGGSAPAKETQAVLEGDSG